MAKIPVRLFRLPRLILSGQPYRLSEEEKHYWINYQFDGESFALDQVSLLETGRPFQVKTEEAGPLGKTRFQFKGIPEKALSAGLHVYPTSWPVRNERKAYLVPLGAQNQKLTADKARLKSDLLPPEGLEVDLRKHEAAGDKFLIVASARKGFACLTGQLYSLEFADGSVLDTALVTCGSLEPRDLADYLKKTFRFPGLPTVNALYSINLRVMGWIVLPPPLWDETFEETEGRHGVRVMTKALAHFSKKMRNAAAQPGGIATAELKTRMSLPDSVFAFLADRLVREGSLRVKDGWYLPTGDGHAYLSPIAQKALKQLDDLGIRGVDLDQEPNSLFRKTYTDLARMDLAVQTETPWVYGLTAWETLRQRLCGPGTLGKQWRIAEVKELLDLSRKPLLGILNQLEQEGWLERQEDHRLVIREFSAGH